MVFDYPTVTAPCLGHVRANIGTYRKPTNLVDGKVPKCWWNRCNIAHSMENCARSLKAWWCRNEIMMYLLDPWTLTCCLKTSRWKACRTSIQHTSVRRSASKKLHKLTWLESTRFVDSAAPWHIPLFCFHHSFTNVTSRSWQDTSTASLKLSTHQVDDVDLDEHITTSLVWYDWKIMLKYLSTPNSLCKMI